jgi:RNA polymerase sigma factor (sigma-70 family)
VNDDRDFDQAFYECLPVALAAAARVLRDPIAAEDAAAEALARMYVAWPRLAGAAYVHAWVVRVTTNLALDAVRRRRRPLRLPWAHAHDDPSEDVAGSVDLADALRALPRRQREAVVLCHLAGMSDREAAAAMNVSSNTLRTHLNRGLSALRVDLRDPKETPSWTT